MNAGLILAGGKSLRLTSHNIPKQFIEVGGQSVISYCLESFKNCLDINTICVVADKRWYPQIGNYIFADAGISRQHSIFNGLKALRPYSPQYVIIHDASRPLVTESDITHCIAAAQMYDGATPSLPVVETIYRSYNEKTIASTPNRDELFIGQTPECYLFEPYYRAHVTYADMLANFRGSSEIAVNAGMKIALTEGNELNFKITTDTDLERFREIVEKR